MSHNVIAKTPPSRAPLNLLVEKKLKNDLRDYCQKKNFSISQVFQDTMRATLNRSHRQQISADYQRDTSILNELKLECSALRKGIEHFQLLVTIYNRNNEKLLKLGSSREIMRLVQQDLSRMTGLCDHCRRAIAADHFAKDLSDFRDYLEALRRARLVKKRIDDLVASFKSLIDANNLRPYKIGALDRRSPDAMFIVLPEIELSITSDVLEIWDACDGRRTVKDIADQISAMGSSTPANVELIIRESLLRGALGETL